MKKRCGNCSHWQKIKNNHFGGEGLCNLHDYRMSSNGGKSKTGDNCLDWKAIPYVRIKNNYTKMEIIE